VSFELFVGKRYLRAKRKQRFLSIVTLIAVAGVSTGVAALVVAMAINNGVQEDLQRHLLGATAHVSLLEKERGFGIEDWRPFVERFEGVEHVEAIAPALYGEVMITGPLRGRGCVLKGVDPQSELAVGDLLKDLAEGSVEGLESGEGNPGIILGSGLAQSIGARLNSVVTVVSPQGELTPFGLVPGYKRFQVAGIFESGYYQYDQQWALAALKPTQQSLSLNNVINAIEFRLDDLNLAEPVGKEIEQIAGAAYATTNWMERNRDIFNALKVEKLVTTITIGLIMLVAALNILTALVMMVMEKTRDIAILISMGARRSQIRKIFVFQGLMIGSVGTSIGLAAGHLLCWAADAYQLIPLDAEIYGLSHVPFAARPWDALGIAVAALAVSYLTTIYPSNTATRVVPVETLRYE
jgi:lipoprotein-releasing system permease protein